MVAVVMKEIRMPAPAIPASEGVLAGAVVQEARVLLDIVAVGN